MHVLIDGYNLLNAANIPSHGYGIGSLERSRLGLLHFLVESLDPAELAQTVVVFDARQPPPGLARDPVSRPERAVCGQVRECRRPDRGADSSGLYAQATHRGLHDHRIQRAAQQRKARAVDSEVWYAEVMRRQSQPEHTAARGATGHAVACRRSCPLVGAVWRRGNCGASH